jgi:hypothetical protein
MINGSHEFQQHAAEQYAQTNERQRETDESSRSTKSILYKVITGILYVRENKEKKPMLYSFDEFWAKDARLKYFFDELYLSLCEKHYNQCVANDYFIKNFKLDR